MSEEVEHAQAVPEEEGPLAVPCARHPNVETVLRCSRCDTPICPRCLVMTPVGARCPNCARMKRLPVFEAAPRHYLFALGAGLVSAVLGAAVLLFVPTFGFFTLLLYAALGYGVGEAVSFATNRKRAPSLAAIAAVFAGLAAASASGLLRTPSLFALAAVVIAAVVAWGRMR